MRQALLIGTFAALWLPLGQQGYLYAEWPVLALGGGMAILFALAATRSEPGAARWPDAAVLLLVLAIYMLHQFEEHGVDLLGRHYAFEASINAMLGPQLGCPAGAPCPFDPQTLYLVNTIGVWWLLASVIAVGGASPVAAIMAVSIMPVNGLIHLGAALGERAYNPGLATAILLFLPLGIGATARLARAHRVPTRVVAAALMYGAVLHLLIAAGIAAVFRGWIGPAGYGLALFAAASLPLATALWGRGALRSRSIR